MSGRTRFALQCFNQCTACFEDDTANIVLYGSGTHLAFWMASLFGSRIGMMSMMLLLHDYCWSLHDEPASVGLYLVSVQADTNQYKSSRYSGC